MGRISTFGQSLYEGRISFDFVGRRKLWYAASAVIVLLAALGFLARGFNYGPRRRTGRGGARPPRRRAGAPVRL